MKKKKKKHTHAYKGKLKDNANKSKQMPGVKPSSWYEIWFSHVS